MRNKKYSTPSATPNILRDLNDSRGLPAEHYGESNLPYLITTKVGGTAKRKQPISSPIESKRSHYPVTDLHVGDSKPKLDLSKSQTHNDLALSRSISQESLPNMDPEIENEMNSFMTKASKILQSTSKRNTNFKSMARKPTRVNLPDKLCGEFVPTRQEELAHAYAWTLVRDWSVAESLPVEQESATIQNPGGEVKYYSCYVTGIKGYLKSKRTMRPL